MRARCEWPTRKPGKDEGQQSRLILGEKPEVRYSNPTIIFLHLNQLFFKFTHVFLGVVPARDSVVRTIFGDQGCEGIFAL